jgi:hypothetical protein
MRLSKWMDSRLTTGFVHLKAKVGVWCIEYWDHRIDSDVLSKMMHTVEVYSQYNHRSSLFSSRDSSLIWLQSKRPI